jgi:hypothetical protein
MARSNPEERQTEREIQRAAALVSTVRGLDTDQSADALRDHAAAQGVSLHAAALAVLATEPTDRLLTGMVSGAG